MHDKKAIDMLSFEEAIDEKNFKSSISQTRAREEDRNIIAYHEAGHAVMSLLLNEPISRASIKSTTNGVGGAVMPSDKETVFMTKESLENSIKISFAGRASEEIKFKDVTTGASNDITQATNIMTNYIERLGFDKDFGLLDITVLAQNHLINSDKVLEKLSKMSIEYYKECKNLLEVNYDKVEVVAQALLEREVLTSTEINELLKQKENS